MKQVFETERLVLKEFNVTDAAYMYALNLDDEVLKYTGDKPFKTINEATQFLINYSDYLKNGFGRWSVFLKNNNEYLGWCGLKLNEEGMIDIGFRFLKKHWNNGYATESATACLNYGFKKLDIKEIIGRVSIENKASIKILEKINMIFWKKDDFEGVENAVYYKIEKKK